MRPTIHDPDKVLAYIIEHKRRSDGNSPTLRQIAERFRTSTSVAAYLVDRLEQMGAVRTSGGMSRGIRVVGGRWHYEGSALDDSHLCNGVAVAGAD